MKVEIWMATDRVGSRMMRTVEFDDEEWAELSEDERYEYVWAVIQENGWISWGWNEK